MSLALFKRNLAKRGKDIILKDRSVGVTGVDLDESFDNPDVVKALIKTVRGTTIFDGSNVEKEVTHEIRIEFIATVTAETWIEFNGRNIDILDVVNCCENDEILILRCNERGIDTLSVNHA